MPRDVPLIFPARGVSTEAAFIAQPGDTAAPGTLQNVRLTDRTTKRPRGASRPGLLRLFAGTVGSGMVQGLLSVQRASSTEYVPGAGALLTGTAKDGSHGTGNGTILDQVPSVLRMIHEDASDDGGPAAVDIIACDFSADGATVYTAINYTNGTNYKCRIKAWDRVSGSLLWSHTISETGVDRYANTIKVSSWLLLVCGGKSTGVGWVRTIKLSDGTQQGSDFPLHNWAYEAIEADVYGSGSSEYALVAFYGSAAAGTTTGGPITPGFIALNFRSGVMKCRIVQPTDVGPFPFYLERATLGTQLSSSHPDYESDHRYLRFSEEAAHDGHGCVPEAIACGTDGSFVVARSNQGWGKDATLTPDPSTNGGLPYISVAKYNSAGVVQWENNVAESVTSVLGTSGYNDLDDPTFCAIDLDSAGNVYVGGRSNVSGFSVYSLSPTGAFRWRQNIGVQVRQAALRVDPWDGNIIVGGDRSALWAGSGGLSANAWKLSANDGSILWGWDFGSAVSCSSVAARAGKLFLGTEYVT